jgi:hypothetical protein
MLIGPSLIDLSAEAVALINQGMAQVTSLINLQQLLDACVHLVIVIVLIVEVVELAKSLYRLIFKRTEPEVIKSGS